MFTAKTLSGDLISLEAEDEFDYCREYQTRFVAPEDRPYHKVSLLKHPEDGEWCVLVTIHEIPYAIEDEEIPSTIFFNNPASFSYLASRGTQGLQRHVSVGDHLDTIHDLMKCDCDRVNPCYEYSLLLATHSPDAFQMLLDRTIPSLWNWEGKLWEVLVNRNKHVQPHWLEYILSNEIIVQSDDGRDGVLSICVARWRELNFLPQLVPFFIENQEYIFWKEFCSNPAAVPFLHTCKEKLSYYGLCSNPNPEVMELVKTKPIWHILYENPVAIDMLPIPPEQKYLRLLARNPAALSYFRQCVPHPPLYLIREMIGNPAAAEFVLPRINELNRNDLFRLAQMPYIFR